MDEKTGQKTGELKLTKPIEVLFEGFDEEVYKKIDSDKLTQSVKETLDNIDEEFFLFTFVRTNDSFTNVNCTVYSFCCYLNSFLNVFWNIH